MSKSEPMRDLPKSVAHPVVIDRDRHAGYLSSYAEPDSYGVEGIPATHIEIVHAGWSDYSGDSVTRSNCRSLLRDFPRNCREITGGYGYTGLVVSLRCRNEFLAEAIAGLADYPLYDEEDHSALEMEMADEAWDDYLESEVHHDLAYGTDKHLGGNRYDTYSPESPEAMGAQIDFMFNHADPAVSGLIREWYYESLGEQDEYPYLETAVNVVFPCHVASVEYVAGKIWEWKLSGYAPDPAQAALPGL